MNQMMALHPIINHVMDKPLEFKFLLMISSIVFLGLPLPIPIGILLIWSTLLNGVSIGFLVT